MEEMLGKVKAGVTGGDGRDPATSWWRDPDRSRFSGVINVVLDVLSYSPDTDLR